MKIKRIFCADCYEWKDLADLESFPEKPGNYYCADCGCVLIESEDNENTKFEFWLPRNTKNKKLNMVINSNDRDHNKVTGHMVSRIRKLAAYETKAKKDKHMLPFSPKRPCHLTVTVYKPTRRRLDTPNLYPTVKPLVDGMTEAGIWTDDNDNVIKSTKFQLGGLSGKKGYYRFVLTIEEEKDNV